jgi:SAM-dependent methyltransferase
VLLWPGTRGADMIGAMSVRVRLVIASALMLFTELMLIRWLGANILNLAYFSNIVLLGSFLGIGLGFLMAKPGRQSVWWFPLSLAVLVLVVVKAPGGIDRSGSDLIYFTGIQTEGGFPPVVTLAIVFAAVALVMTGPGLLTAQCFLELPRLDAYRYDLIGSLAGTVLFAVMSLLSAPPIVWAVFLVAAGVALIRRPRWVVGLSFAVFLGVMVSGSLQGDIWSPYYKIQTIPSTQHRADGSTYEAISILANGIPHQSIVPVDTRIQAQSFYPIPYERRTSTSLDDVLVVGAGNGSDVALALLKGAKHVDAVEIDPRIHDLGVADNPDKPFADPRVTSYITDGRAFLHNTDHRYDLIVFALPDSLTLVAGSNQLRLESYLFTQEALENVKSLLKPDGTFSMYNYYREDWLVGRLANTAAAAFGHPACIDTYANRSAVITVGITAAAQKCPTPGSNATTVASVAGPDPVHDDRPFLYLKTPSIPATFLITIALIIGMSLVAVRIVGGPFRRMAPYLDLACLGAAFLLLETRAVTWSALLFGTTWVVNAIVFAGVLVVVLLAVEVTRRLPVRPTRPWAFVFLAATLLVAWLVPTVWLLSLPLGLRVIAAVAIAFGPIFASNIVFATRFNSTDDATSAFAANLLGAMVGGCMEYLALIIGYPALLGLAGLLYLAAFLLGPRLSSRNLTPVSVEV